MTEKEFKKILREEGVPRRRLINKAWLARPHDNLNEADLREAARMIAQGIGAGAAVEEEILAKSFWILAYR